MDLWRLLLPLRCQGKLETNSFKEPQMLFGSSFGYLRCVFRFVPVAGKTCGKRNKFGLELFLLDAKNKNVQRILILSGDHLYRMDYVDFVQKHIEINADITVSCVPMDDSQASDYGLMKIDETGRIIHFAEKPKGVALKAMQVDTSLLGLSAKEAMKFPYIASIGVYVFKIDVLLNLLRWKYPSCNDFGSEIIPSAVKDHNVQAYLFCDY